MKICDVVLNSIWYDPRVRKQIFEYLRNGIELCCVGYECDRYDVEKVNAIPCETNIIMSDKSYDTQKKSVFRKIRHFLKMEMDIRDAIVAYKPDCIHANDLNALIPAYWAKKKLKCRLVYDSHEVYVENHTKGALASFIWKCIERYIVHKVDKMICVSHAASDYFAKIYKIAPPMVVTNCALRSENIDCLKTIQKNEGFEILNHGQFYEGRGYDIMANALPLMIEQPEIKFALRGFGNMEHMLHESVSKAPNSEQFRFYPRVSVEELIPEAAKSHVGVAVTVPICLNFEMSISNKIFEYAAAGLPVIMSNIPEHRYLNGKYKFGVILKDNTPECFAEAVKKLYADKEFYDVCCKNAIKLSNELNWENEFSKLISCEKSLCK